MRLLKQYAEIWVVDFEYTAPDGCNPRPVSMVGVEYWTGRKIVLWRDELEAMAHAPFDIGPNSLVVSYYAPAEMACFLSLGWELPDHVLDLYAEFRSMTNGLVLPAGNGLLGALKYYGIGCMAEAEKDANRALILRGGPFTPEDKVRILLYCAADVDGLVSLLGAMEGGLSPLSLLRGRYMKAVARMERLGLPIDVESLDRLRTGWPGIVEGLVRQVDEDFGVFDGRSFRQQRFAEWLHRRGIHWPALESGALALDDDTFKDMVKLYPELRPLHELRGILGKMRTLDLAVGPDGRNRCLLSPFSSRTGRNQPSSTRFLFSAAAWLRNLARPCPGSAIAYIDYSQQEFGVAGALSGDEAMMNAYRSGDPYMEFARMAGAVPARATKASHPRERELYKTTTLGVQFCMSEFGLAFRLGITLVEARNLLSMHRQAFRKFWQWSDAAVNYASLTGSIHTVFGWNLNVTVDTKERSLRNFPCQANGAEILRLACCLATERGIAVCAPVHDALVVEGPADCIEDIVRGTQQAMREAGEIVLNGFTLNSDAVIVRHPDRFMDPRGASMWARINDILEKINHADP